MRVELDKEEDGRWVADVIDLPGVLAYGATREEALARAEGVLERPGWPDVVFASRLESSVRRWQDRAAGYLSGRTCRGVSCRLVLEGPRRAWRLIGVDGR